MRDRQELKHRLDEIFSGERPRLCLACGKPFAAFDMHEGIVTRRDAQGWKPTQRQMIMTELNCIPLHHGCHLDNPPSRDLVWEYQKGYYGTSILLEWYEGLPWKSGKPPRNF